MDTAMGHSLDIARLESRGLFSALILSAQAAQDVQPAPPRSTWICRVSASRSRRTCSTQSGQRVFDTLPRHTAFELKTERARLPLCVAPCGDRTHDHTLTKRIFYQLS